jgi:translocation and assembly module TamB
MTQATRLILALVTAALLAAGVALAQDGEDKSRFVRTLEGMLSTPERQVSISGLEGAFSSNPTIAKVVVSDREGAWLELDNVAMVWSRTALFRRVLDVESLTAGRVALLRRPVPAEATVAAEESAGSAGLPVDVHLGRFELADVLLGAPVLGREARLSASGSAEVTADVVAAQLAVERRDQAGSLALDLRFQPADNVLAADMKLSEPAGGLVAEALDLRGRPAIALSLAGSGPLDNWQADLNAEADGRSVLSGRVSVARVDTGYRIGGDLAAALATLLPERYAALLAGDSRLAFDVTRRADGGLAIDSASLNSEGVQLSAKGALTPDMVPESAELSLRLGQAGRATLPFVPGDVSLASLEANAVLDAGAPAAWRADIKAAGVESSFAAIGSLNLTASGRAEGLADPAARATSFTLDATATEVVAADAELAVALGPTLDLTAAGAWAAGQPVTFESLQAVLTGASASFAGTANAVGLDGRIGLAVTDLKRLAGLAGRPLAGGTDLTATGSVSFAGAFDLRLDGTARDLGLGIAALDPLLAGETRIIGGLARAGSDIRADGLTLTAERASAELSGSLAAAALDLTISASLADLAAVTPRASGAASLTARVTGTQQAPRVEAEATADSLVLMGRPFTGASARFSGVVAGPDTQGEATLAGDLAGTQVAGSARLAAGENGARRLEELLVTVGESRVAGDLTLGADSLMAGQLSIVSPDLSKVAPLLLVEASGMLKADVTLAPENGGQSARFSATATDLVYETITLDSAEASGTAQDLFRAPQIDGSFAIRNLRTGGLVVLAADGTATRQGASTGFAVKAQLADGSADLAGTLEPRGAGLALALQRFSFARAGLDLSLAAPTTIAIEAGTARFEATTLRVGGGTVTLAGAAGQQLDLTADLRNVPAALVNSFAPDLGAEGTISGTARVTGTAAAPAARFDANWQGASVAASRNAGLGALAITATGDLAGQELRLTSRMTGAGGLALDVAGRVGIAAGAPIDLAIRGALPLALGNTQLASRGAALQGTLNVDVHVGGTAADPRFSGRITSEGGGFIDPGTGIVLRNLSLSASVANDRIVIDRLNAASGEGTVTASGSIGLAPAAGFPVDIRLGVRQARYVDGTLVAARFDADLTLTGTFRDGPVLGGRVFIDRAEITVPERLPRGSVAVDVKHVRPPADVQRTLTLARDRSDGRGRSGGSAFTLDITIEAPQQIFIRGRGLDAEVGGQLRLTGPISALIADGSFEMRRGRLDIFTQRITFDRGTVTFAGDLDPILDFTGTTTSTDITVTVTVSGRASDPEVIFSSVPELPQDEVLAHLIFNRGIGELSPVQIARLASAASALSGASSGGGLLNQLRESTGLDDLDVVTTDEGAPALAAGRYVSENVYIGLQQGATAGSSRVTIDLDITKDVKARAALSAQGSSSLGVFFEREY